MQAGHWSLTDQDGAGQNKGCQRQDAGGLKPNPCGRGSNMNNNQATKGAAIWCQFPLYFSSSQMVITPHRSKCAQRFNLTLYWLWFDCWCAERHLALVRKHWSSGGELRAGHGYMITAIKYQDRACRFGTNQHQN